MENRKIDNKMLFGVVAIIAVVIVGIYLLFFVNPTDSSSAPSNDQFTVANTTPIIGISVGNIAPDFSLETIEGKTVSLKDFRGKSVILNFWASWCPFCVDEMPLFQKIADENPEKLVVLGVNLQEADEPIKKFVKSTGVKYRILKDPALEVKRAFNVFTQPATYFIDKEGIITEKKFGPILEKELREKLKVTFSSSVAPKLIAFESIPARITDVPVQESGTQKHTVPLEEILRGCPGKDCIPSIDKPVFESVASADSWLKDDSVVLGLTEFNTKIAYPFPILDWHEIVNDTVDGVPVLITYCPLCATGIAFHRNINGQAVEFGVSGKLRNTNLIMYDRQTETYWQQVTGQGIVGELTGYELTKIPIDVVQWKDWKKQFPDSKVLSRDTGQIRSYGSYPYGDYKTSSSVGFGVVPTDRRLHEKAIVFGFESNGAAKAYGLESMRGKKILNDSVGKVDLVAVFDEDLETVKAFERKVNGKTVEFELKNGMLFESSTNSFWSLTGEFVSGETTDQDLTRLNLDYGFWFSWAEFFPETKLA